MAFFIKAMALHVVKTCEPFYIVCLKTVDRWSTKGGDTSLRLIARNHNLQELEIIK